MGNLRVFATLLDAVGAEIPPEVEPSLFENDPRPAEFKVPFTPEFRAFVDGRLRDPQPSDGSRFLFDESLAKS